MIRRTHRYAATAAAVLFGVALGVTAASAAASKSTSATKSAAKSGGKTAPKSAGVDRAKAPPLAGAPSLTLPPIHTFKLSNGLEATLVEMHEVPVVDVTLLVRAGAVRDPDDLPGLATFTANMLDEGAGKRDALGIADEVAFLGASLSSGAGPENASVNLHCTRARLDAALAIMADVALQPAFADSEVARQRELRMNALLQLRDRPTDIAPIAFNAIVFGDAHPYGRPTSGNEVSARKLDRDRVRRFYDTFYRPGNAKLLIVGDIGEADARQKLESAFGSWKAGDVPAFAAATDPAPAARKFYLVDKPGAAQSVIRIGHLGVARNNADYFPLRVMNTILGGSFTSRLNQNLRETHGYTYGANARYDMRRLKGPFVAGASVVTAKTDSSLIEFFKELRRMRDEVVPASEVDKAKNYLALGFPGDFETTADAAVQYLDLMAHDIPLDDYATYIERLQKVTPADVQRVAKTYMNPDQFAVVVVGDRKVIEDSIKALNEGPIAVRDIWGHEVQP